MKITKAPVFGVVALFALTACGSNGQVDLNGGSAANNTGDGEEIHMATVPGLDLAALKLGEEQGFFEEQDLQLRTTIADSGGAVITGTVQGSYDVGYAAPTPILTAVSEGSELKLLGGSNSINYDDPEESIALFVSPDSDIESMEDLEGKTVAVNALRAASDFCLQAAAQQHDLGSEDFDTIELPLNQIPTSVMDDQVDAGMLFEPFSTMALASGALAISSPCQEGLPNESPYGFYFTSDVTFDGASDKIERFSEAARKSTEYANDNPEELREATVTYTDMDPEIVDQLNLTTLQYDINIEAYEENIQLMEDLGFIDSAESVEDFMP